MSDTNCRTAMVAPTAGDSIREAHSYEYDNNGNIVYVNTSRVKPDMTTQPDTVQRAREERFRWDEENRLTALSQNVTKEPSPCHIEGPSTQNAEYYGWSLMALHSNTHSESRNLRNSITHFFKSLFK